MTKAQKNPSKKSEEMEKLKADAAKLLDFDFKDYDEVSLEDKFSKVFGFTTQTNSGIVRAVTKEEKD